MGPGQRIPRKPTEIPGRLADWSENSHMATVTGTQPFQWTSAGPKYGVGMNVDPSRGWKREVSSLFTFDVSLGLGTVCEDLSVNLQKLISNSPSKGKSV